MSGPKVVRIVTREELLAICNAQIARLDAAIQQWTKIGQRNGGLAENDIAAVTVRRAQIAELRRSEDFMGVQKQVPLEIDFLKRDTQFRLELAAKKTFEAKQRGRRNGQAGRVLLAALEKAGQEIPNDLRHALENASGESLEIDAAISRALTLLTPDKGDTVTDAQAQLAAFHGEDEIRQTFPSWLAKQANANTSTFRKLDQALAELVTIGDAETVTDFVQRAEILSAQPHDGRTQLLIDSLSMDVLRVLRTTRSAAQVFDLITQFQAEVAQLSSTEANTMGERIATAIKARDIDFATTLVAELPKWIDGQRHAAAAEARRSAMLKGLSELGYSVNEDLQTAWAQDSKIVIRKAASPDYGIEVVGGMAEKMQVRVVGFGVPGEARDKARDRDMETIWCGEFGKLQACLAEDGSDILIEKALAVGTTPVKVISQDANLAAIDVKKPDIRTL